MTTTQFPLDFFPFAEGETLTIAPITVLLGYNNVGKTTILHHIPTASFLGSETEPNSLSTKAMANILRGNAPFPDYKGKKILHCLEQPEKGLHPCLHGDIAEALVKKLPQNDCAIIETHSENFVLRLRVLVAQGKLPTDALSIVFVIRESHDSPSYLRHITVDREGTLSDWEDGFFCENLREIHNLDRAIIANKNPN